MIEIIEERSKVYGIGVKAFFIGNAFLSNTDLIAKAKPIIEDLGSMLNKTVFMGKVVGDEIAYIYKYEPMAMIVTTCAIGSRTFIHCTSLGKSILAYDEELWEIIRNKSLTKKTSHTITDHDALLQDIQKVRDRGYAVDDREQNESLLCIGAPIFDHTGKAVAALSISGLYSEDVNIQYEGALIREKAMLISHKLGYQSEKS
jgi:DNA-binding IclR family transcriptional regulator